MNDDTCRTASDVRYTGSDIPRSGFTLYNGQSVWHGNKVAFEVDTIADTIIVLIVTKVSVAQRFHCNVASWVLLAMTFKGIG